MLINSDRHKRADLEIWEQLSQADSLHAQESEFFRHCQDAKQQILLFHRKPKPYYVATSWGKDSVVLLHLFCALGYRPKVVFVRQLDNENPESYKVRDTFLARFPCDYEEVSYSYRDADDSWYDNGKPVRWYQILHDLSLKYGLHVTGVRADESSKRMLRFKSYGCETRMSFSPFRFFNVKDIFAYMALFNLPIHPNYAMLGGGRWDRDRLRVTAIGNDEGRRMGRAQWENEYYGDVLRRMQRSSQHITGVSQ